MAKVINLQEEKEKRIPHIVCRLLCTFCSHEERFAVMPAKLTDSFVQCAACAYFASTVSEVY